MGKCSPMFDVRLMGKKLLRARRAATWGREGRQKEECRMALRAATGGAAQGHDWGMQNARQMDDGRSRLRQIKTNGMFNRSQQRQPRRTWWVTIKQVEPKSLFGNYEGRCGEGFWLWPRRRVPSIPAAGCKEREGFRGKGRLASLLLSRRSTRDILLRRASPSGLFPENSAPRSFQTGSKAVQRASR